MQKSSQDGTSFNPTLPIVQHAEQHLERDIEALNSITQRLRTVIAFGSQQPIAVLQASSEGINIVVTPTAGQSNGSGIGNVIDPNNLQTLSLSCIQNESLHVNVRDLTGCVSRRWAFQSASGGTADIWEGSCGRVKVAVKVPRTHVENPHRSKDDLRSELYTRQRNEFSIWSLLSHDNVVRLLGTTSDFANSSPFGPMMSFVSLWMENGHLTGYLQQVEVSLNLPRCFEILHDVASGLSYIHSMSIVHGDISGSNILIGGDGKARLNDFGLSTVVSSGCGGTPRWAAPERFHIYKIPSLTTACDIYSYGGIMVHVLSGKMPYHQLKHDAEILLNMDKRERPLHERVTDTYWDFILACWQDQPDKRPEAAEVLEGINKSGQELL